MTTAVRAGGKARVPAARAAAGVTTAGVMGETAGDVMVAAAARQIVTTVRRTGHVDTTTATAARATGPTAVTTVTTGARRARAKAAPETTVGVGTPMTIDRAAMTGPARAGAAMTAVMPVGSTTTGVAGVGTERDALRNGVVTATGGRTIGRRAGAPGTAAARDGMTAAVGPGQARLATRRARTRGPATFARAAGRTTGRTGVGATRGPTRQGRMAGQNGPVQSLRRRCPTRSQPPRWILQPAVT